jgi:hypothetical protein
MVGNVRVKLSEKQPKVASFTQTVSSGLGSAPYNRKKSCNIDTTGRSAG